MFRAGRRRFLLAAAGLGSTLGLGAWRQFGSRWIHEETGRSSSRRTSQALGTKVSIVVLHDNAQQWAMTSSPGSQTERIANWFDMVPLGT